MPSMLLSFCIFRIIQIYIRCNLFKFMFKYDNAHLLVALIVFYSAIDFVVDVLSRFELFTGVDCFFSILSFLSFLSFKSF